MTPYILLFILFLVFLGAAVALRDLEKEQKPFEIKVIATDNLSLELARINEAMRNLTFSYSNLGLSALGASKAFAGLGKAMQEASINDDE